VAQTGKEKHLSVTQLLSNKYRPKSAFIKRLGAVPAAGTGRIGGTPEGMFAYANREILLLT